MSNFKSGSGNLDFDGGDDEEEEVETTTESVEALEEGDEHVAARDSEASESSQTSSMSSNTQDTSDQSTIGQESTQSSTASSPSEKEYPYFVRRSNVGDERDTRLEIHVRDKVADREAKFRNELAEHLEANEISKTDAREFALLAAFHNPERVAELMQDEGFGTLG